MLLLAEKQHNPMHAYPEANITEFQWNLLQGYCRIAASVFFNLILYQYLKKSNTFTQVTLQKVAFVDFGAGVVYVFV